LYVDELQLIGHPELVREVKAALSARFQMIDLGRLSNFIGIEIEHNSDYGAAFLHQTKLISSILSSTGMDSSRSCATPAAADLKLSHDLTPPVGSDSILAAKDHDGIDYRRVVGQLLYLRFTRPDLAFITGDVST